MVYNPGTMNTTLPQEIKGELDKIKHDVSDLKTMMHRLMKRLATRPREKDITEEDLFREARRIFEVTSEPSPDDDNIAPHTVIKPLDWSGYAQNRSD